MEIIEAKRKLIKILKNSKNEIDYNAEISLILQDILNVNLTQLLLQTEISEEKFKICEKITKKRSAGKPLQYLLKKWNFYNIEIYLNSNVFIPRPETEILVDFTLNLKNKPLKIIDLCTGTGCVSVAIAKNLKNVRIKAIDFSKQAIKCAKKNISKFKQNVQLFYGNVLNEKLAKNFNNWANLIVCNPPYLNQFEMENMQKEVTYEPKMALYGGKNGLVFYEKICRIWKNSLKTNGLIAFEIGYKQKHEVELILQKNKFAQIKTINDCFGNNRLTFATKLN